VRVAGESATRGVNATAAPCRNRSKRSEKWPLGTEPFRSGCVKSWTVTAWHGDRPARPWCGLCLAQPDSADDFAGLPLFLARAPIHIGMRVSQPCREATLTMSDSRDPRSKSRRRAGRPPAGAKLGEKVKDYPQLSIRVPQEMKARLNAVSAVTGLAQWRVVVEAINCFVHDLSPHDRELVDGLSERMIQSET
jgi:predicted DNA-binding protein